MKWNILKVNYQLFIQMSSTRGNKVSASSTPWCTEELLAMEIKHFKNIIIVACGFLLLFTAFGGLQTLQVIFVYVNFSPLFNYVILVFCLIIID